MDIVYRNEKVILDIVKKVNKLYYRKPIIGPYFEIIDFYNIYCSMIKFNRFKTFSRKTWELVIKHIVNSNKAEKIFVIAKPIFEINDIDIFKITKKYPKLNYIVVNDLNPIKSLNKERDDFICLFLQYIYNKNSEQSIIISNDTFSNYNKIIDKIKPLSVNIYTKTYSRQVIFSDRILNNIKKGMLNNKENVKDKRTKFFY